MNVTEVVSGYTDFLKYSGASKSTVEGYSREAKRWVAFLRGKERFDQLMKSETFPTVTHDDAERYIDLLMSQESNYNNLRRIKSVMKNFRDYLDMEYSMAIPSFDDIEIGSKEPTSEKVIYGVRHDEVLAIADCASSARNKAMIRLAYEAGMRRNELNESRVDHLNVADNNIQIYRNGIFERLGWYGEECQALILAYLSEIDRGIDYVNQTRNRFQGERKVVHSGYLFETVEHNKLSTVQMHRILKETAYEYYVNKYGGDRYLTDLYSSKVNFDVLRDSRRAYLLSEGMSRQEVQKFMGSQNRMNVAKHDELAKRLYPDKFKGG